MTARILSLALVAAGLTLPATAQSDGPAVGTPAVVLLGPGVTSSTGRMATDTFHRRRAGFVGWQPEGPALGPGEPVFSTSAMFGGGAPPPFRINAYSIGLDEVLATVPAAGRSFVAVPPGAWGAVLFSVSSTSTAAPGSLLDDAAAEPDGAGADLFSWMLPGSFLAPSVVPCFSSADSQRAADSPELDLAGVGGGLPELTAFDVYTPWFLTGPPLRPMLPAEPSVYFSVHVDDVFPPGGGPGLVPPPWFAPSLPSAASILVTKWDAATDSWSMPSVFLSYLDLGLDLGDDIDGLAVDRARCKALFSVVDMPGKTLAEQLQVVAFPCPPASGSDVPGGGRGDGSYQGPGVSVGEYRADNGDGTSTSVAERVGLEGDGEIDGVCTIDPGDQSALGNIAYGTPVFPISPAKVMGAQVYRDEAVFGPTITAVVTGVPPGPFLPERRVELWLGLPPPGGVGAYGVWPTPMFVDVLDGSVGDGLRTVPLTTPLLGVLSGLSVDMLWVVRPAGPKLSAVAMRLGL